jgi:hypothetical protein
MKEIPLTQGKVAIVDDEDFKFLSQWKWHVLRHRWKHGETWYARRGRGIMMHNVIAGIAGIPNVDHQDGDGLHNWRSNLRPCTRSQNQGNRRKRAPGSSRYKGVSWIQSKRLFRVGIRQHGKSIHLGYFKDELEAASAYDSAATKQFGEFALTNFPGANQ